MEKFSREEQEMFQRMISYYVKAEEREIIEISKDGHPDHKDNFIKQCKERIDIFRSIDVKVKKELF